MCVRLYVSSSVFTITPYVMNISLSIFFNFRKGLDHIQHTKKKSKIFRNPPPPSGKGLNSEEKRQTVPLPYCMQALN